MKIIYALSHPIQYQTPLINHLIRQGVDLEVIYATDITAKGYQDKGFGTQVQWDLPLLDGHPSKVLFPSSEIPNGFRSFWSHYSALLRALSDVKADAVWVHGWGNSFPLAAMAAAKRCSLPILMRAETHMGCLRGGRFRRSLHSIFLRSVFSQISQFLAVGIANKEFYVAHGVADDCIHMTPYVVDNDRFRQTHRMIDQASVKLRCELQIKQDRPVVLYSAKLISVKDPATLIRAIGAVKACDPLLVIVGDGELRTELVSLAEQVAPNRVRFLGFKNQSELPALYAGCDLFVLPSTFEPWGLVINEVMNASKPVLVSDKVGSAKDLVRPGKNGDIFPAGDVKVLTHKLEEWLSDPHRCKIAGARSVDIISQWGFAQVAEGIENAISALSANSTV